MHIFENKEFDNFDDFESGNTYSDLEFRNCVLQGGTLSATRWPASRSTVRNVRIFRCRVVSATIYAPIIEDVVVDGLRITELLRSHGAVFKHVVLRGKIGPLLLSRALTAAGDVEKAAAFRQANEEYYRHVDWALDISQGEFADLDIRGVPGTLIRRDSATQARMTRQAVVNSDWRELPFRSGVTQVALSLMLDSDDPDLTYVAGRRSRDFRNMVADIELLRKEGIAEPD